MSELAYANPVSADRFQNQLSQPEDAVLTDARQHAADANTSFAGSVAPQDAWRLVEQNVATLLDVRTAEERKFVGYVPQAQHVAWATGTSMNRNPRFVKEVETKLKDKTTTILLLCRSGKRSAEAASALTKAGFTNAFNVLEGFEGNLNAAQQRGTTAGWRVHQLPWIQD